MKPLADYYIIIEIITNVLRGKNLVNEFNYQVDRVLNVGKVKDITFGVFRNYNILASIFALLVPKKINEIQLKSIILIGLYEIKYTNKVEYAVTNDLVNITSRLYKNNQIKNFINAVLRNYLRSQKELDIKLSSDFEYKYNFPLWMINKLTHDYKDNYQDIIASLNGKPKLGIRVNQRKIKLLDYLALLDSSNIKYNKVNDFIYLMELSNYKLLPKFEQGYVSIQDIHAQELINFVDIENGCRVLDACSAPGGKACQILENKSVDITCLDIDNSRLDKLRQNLIRLNLTANIKCGDARNNDWWDHKLYDYVIADVPCSASGTIKKNPDIKYIRTVDDITNFVKLQRDIVHNLWKMLKSNGILIYITCSIFIDENKNNIDYFLDKYRNMQLLDEKVLLPQDYADGFYYAKLKKLAI